MDENPKFGIGVPLREGMAVEGAQRRLILLRTGRLRTVHGAIKKQATEQDSAFPSCAAIEHRSLSKYSLISI
jgi:hypothetical protein